MKMAVELHYAQASVYAMLGMERLRDIHYGSGKYGFDSKYIDLQYAPDSTMPDIFNKN